MPAEVWKTPIVLLAALLLAWPSAAARAAEEEPVPEPAAQLAAAERLSRGGRYLEAIELLEPLAEGGTSAASLALARCLASIGVGERAEQVLREARRRFADDSQLAAESGRLAWERGRRDEARRWTDEALRLDPKNLPARRLDAELHRAAGDLDRAAEATRWFIDYYNAADRFERAEDLYHVGLAAAQYARWNRLHDQFRFLVNDLYPDALALEADFWPAHWQAAVLFLEKYNEADAAREIERGLRINPNAVPLLVARAELALQSYRLESARRAAERALEINPRSAAALRVLADIELANFDPRAAAPILARAAELNPLCEATLGRQGAVFLVLDAPAGDAADGRLAALSAEVLARNPAAGEFHEALADSLDRLRKWPDSVRFYEEAIRLLPQAVGPRGKLGLVHMRLGDETTARQLLEESFEIDPFNVRVKNSLAVLEVLDDYATLETEHFILRYDPRHDELLARHMAEYLERVYPELSRELDYRLPEKTLIEVFHRARNTGGHGWFSARMVGLPHVHTIAACAGGMVAMVSPNDLPQRINWARILKHELVHVINLQQTDFNIPHWYTEALAVHFERTPRPDEWNRMLARRVPAGEVFDLETINLGFIRPESSEDWQMAYCQAELYAEYMLQRFGDDALRRMLAAYADNLSTPEAIRRSFEVEPAEFERGYRERLNRLVADLPARAPPRRSEAELDLALRADPNDAQALAEGALALLRREALPQAAERARRALRAEAGHPLALYVQARLRLQIGETAEAVALLERAVEHERLEPEPLRLLAAVRYRQERFAESEALYRRGRRSFPGDVDWLKGLVRVLLRGEQTDALREALTELADREQDDPAIRKMLAQLALRRRDHAAAERWATEAVHIEVHDVEAQRMLAEALAGGGRHARAAERYEIAVQLQPDSPALRFALADALLSAGDREAALRAVRELLRRVPDYPGAELLLENLEQEP